MVVPPESFEEEPEITPVEPVQPPGEGVISPAAVEGETPQEVDTISIEDLTLAEVMGQMLRAPRETLQGVMDVVSAPIPGQSTKRSSKSAAIRVPNVRAIKRDVPTVAAVAIDPMTQREAVQLMLRLFAVIVAAYGNWILATERSEIFGLDVGVPYLVMGFVLWVVAEVYGNWPQLKHWYDTRGTSRAEPSAVEARDEAVDEIGDDLIRRLLLAGGGIIFTLLTFIFTAGNRFTIPNVFAWVASIVLWVMVFAPRGWGVGRFWAGVRAVRLPSGATLWMLLGIMVVATIFRMYDLNAVPVEMTSDHVEKILDAQRVLNGTTQIFFSNNGGREPIQFYLMAFISQLPGLGLNFFTLKFLTVLEGLVTIPLLWWMGREIIGKEEPKLGNAVGLALAALVAVSYWHVMLSRLGLRIILTVLITTLVVIFFSRAMRYNRRGDFIKVGLILGIGMYAYQAVRMLPVAIIIGIGLVIVMGWRQKQFFVMRYVKNLLVLIVIALVVFVPLLRFWIDSPNDFWRRTSGRLLGDELIQTTDAQGNIIERAATREERMAAIQNNVTVLFSTIRNALLMYNWKGDVAWITAAPNRPQMDVFTGTFLIVGAAAWLARMIRRRDPADWLMPILLFVMLLPSALSIAYPIENPSATRTSGSLPEAYLFAALPLALIWSSVRRLFANWRGIVSSFAVVGLVLGAVLASNWTMYFGEYSTTYLYSSPAPYTEAGRFLRGFSASGGGLGNAYMIAYPYWWDHRAVGIEAGVTDWPNGIVTLDDVPNFLHLAWLKSDEYRLDADKDLLFFYSPQDGLTDARLKEWFPSGYGQLVTSYKPGDEFMIYRVPKLGHDGFTNFLLANDIVP